MVAYHDRGGAPPRSARRRRLGAHGLLVCTLLGALGSACGASEPVEGEAGAAASSGGSPARVALGAGGAAPDGESPPEQQVVCEEGDAVPPRPSDEVMQAAVKRVEVDAVRCVEGVIGRCLSVTLTFNCQGAVQEMIFPGEWGCHEPVTSLDEASRACIEAALASAQVPAFSQPSVSASFSFKLPRRPRRRR